MFTVSGEGSSYAKKKFLFAGLNCFNQQNMVTGEMKLKYEDIYMHTLEQETYVPSVYTNNIIIPMLGT